MIKNDEYFMNQALVEARKSLLLDEVPVGAVIVKNDKIIARGHNLREKSNDPTAHAEIVAIRKACRKIGAWRLDGCRIYVTIEPCPMCAGALLWTRIDAIVYGAKDPKGGALGSSFNLFEQKNLNHHPQIVGGVLNQECGLLVSNFFKAKRAY
ncbi:MAG: nucleoside deaminase [Bacteroidia bacterium]|nr:nucleoside deaminase [Bacteroidia bacterium]